MLAHGVQRYGCLGRQPRTQTIYTHPRYQKTLFLGQGVQRRGCLGRHPRTQRIFLGIAHFKHTHPRYPKTRFLVHGVQRYGCLGRPQEPKEYILASTIQTHPSYVSKTLLLAHGVQMYGCLGHHPRTQRIFLALPISNTPIPGIQNHFFWPMVCRGMGVWGATLEPRQYILALPIAKHPHARYPKTSFLAHGVQRYGCLGRHPRTQNNMFWYFTFQTPSCQVFKNTFSDPWCAEPWVFGAPLQNPNSIFWHCPFQRHRGLVIKNFCFGSWCAEVWVFAAPPHNPNNIFSGPWCAEVLLPLL